MGLLAKLFGRHARFEDHVYQKADGKRQPFVKAAEAAFDQGSYPLAVCHFKSQVQQIVELFDAAGLQHVVLDQIDRARLNNAAELVRDRVVGVILSEHLPKPGSKIKKTPNAAPVRVLLFEHYPIPTPDDRVLALDGFLSAPVEFHCYTTLEDACMIPFVDRIRNLMASLGMAEDEEMNGSMLSKSIRRAQEKLATSIHSADHRADSPEEWLRINTDHYRNQQV